MNDLIHTITNDVANGVLETLTDSLGKITPQEQLGRQAWLIVSFHHKNITQELNKYFLSATYTDNLSGQADDISITLEDRGGLWSSDWLPDVGGYLSVSIGTYNWESLSEGYNVMHLGSFEVDEIEISDAPSTVTIKAVSVTVAETSTLRTAFRSKTWENLSLWRVANDIATENNMSLLWDCDENPNIKKTEQTDESDLEFLQKMCNDAGFALKIAISKIIVFDEAKYEKKEPVMTLLRPGTVLPVALDEEEPQKPSGYISDYATGYTFTKKTRDIYKSCRVRYAKSQDKIVIEGIFQDPNKENGQELRVNQSVDSVAEAERLAKKKLREKNREEWTGSYNRPGCFLLVAGVTVQFENFGKFSGKYLVTKATHNIGATYTTSISVRRCIDGY